MNYQPRSTNPYIMEKKLNECVGGGGLDPSVLEEIEAEISVLGSENATMAQDIIDIKGSLNSINDNLDDVQNNLTELFTPDLSTYTAPTIFSSRLKDIVGGYKIVGDIVFVNMNATINTSLSANSAAWICTNLPIPTYTTALNVSVGDNSGDIGTFARVQTDGVFMLMPVRTISANQPLFLKGYYKKA